MFINAVNNKLSSKNFQSFSFEIGGTYIHDKGYHFVKDDPSIIFGHPGFENPNEFRYLEVEPLEEPYEPYNDGTYIARKIKIIREIPIGEIRVMTKNKGWFNQNNDGS
ncbi:hypothetical protein RAC89_25295 [Paenibacillus sp. GD4]|uniref:DUF7666 domain-containing protein n=1 Tax=Paenibacillus sp. GD4 TaxID=3068890 RepID=UPI00279644A7|nr:hypothetical protein [Paenibacillus sp. GD4]MDQ1913721.1 hypothetical protein [Paenibacillus sp. GD4]